MLENNRIRPAAETSGQLIDFISLGELYKAATGFARRQYSVVALVFVLFLGLGIVYLLTSPPRYVGHAVFVIDPSNSPNPGTPSQQGDLPVDTSQVDTQIEILKSDNIAASVVKDLHLTDDAEFTTPYPGFIGSIVGLVTKIAKIGSSSADLGGEDGAMSTAVGVFERNLKVNRVGLTYAIDIDYQSYSPDRAAQVANAVGDAYVVDALDAKYQTTRRASVWLQDRLKELRQQSTDAEQKVNEFKRNNNIVDTGGSLLNEQQLAQLNSTLTQVQATTAEAKARMDRVQAILDKGAQADPLSNTGGTVTDTLQNPVITQLRQQYLALAATETDWARRYGVNHLAVVNLRNQMQSIQHNILDELGRIAESYKSDYEIAQARQASVQQSLSALVKESQTVNGAEVTLRDLQSSADTYSALYNNFLQRYMESVQQQSFPVTEARIITPAKPPFAKSAPNGSLTLALASIVGLMCGFGIGVFRELSDRVFRTTAQVKDRLDADCLAIVPIIKGVGKQVPLRIASGSAPDDRIIAQDSNLLRTVIDSPFSNFTEAIRGLKVAIDRSRVTKTNKVIAMTSSLPNEGKSTVGTALAQIIAHSGSRVLLIDADIRNPTLSRKLAPGAVAGLLEVISGSARLVDVIWTDPTTGLSFLPTVVASRLAHSSEVLASEATKKVFDQLREVYEYIIVDLSPLAPIVDARATTHLMDSFLFVVEWGRTKIDFADHTLGMASGIYENLLGVVLNKADMKKIGRYENYRGNYHEYRYYAKYGYTE